MNFDHKTVILFASLILALVLLNGAVNPAAADGGMLPTATPTQALITVVVVTPQAAKDLLPQEPGVATQPAAALLGEQAPVPDALTAQTGRSNLLRILTAVGIVVLVVLLVGFLVFRLRG